MVTRAWTYGRAAGLFHRRVNTTSTPFREGNGHASREFMRLLFLRNGYRVDWNAVPMDELMCAMVDSVYDTAHLERVLKLCLKKNI